jgi:hypothetical protein
VRLCTRNRTHLVTRNRFSPWAQQPIETNYGIICDTPEQAARNIRGETLASINADNPIACANANVAYIKMDKGEHVVTPRGTWLVTKIFVIGLVVGNEIQDIEPTVQYSAF